MSGDVAVVFDTTALLAYSEGRLAVGELITEIAEEHRHVVAPAACLVQARAAAVEDTAVARLMLLTTLPAVLVLPLGPDDTGSVDPLWRIGDLTRDAGGDLGIGHAAHLAVHHDAYYATMRPKLAEQVLPAGWGILDLGG